MHRNPDIHSSRGLEYERAALICTNTGHRVRLGAHGLPAGPTLARPAVDQLKVEEDKSGAKGRIELASDDVYLCRCLARPATGN